MSIVDLYNGQVKALSLEERLRLASLILNDIPPESLTHVSDEWSDEDLRDFARQAWHASDNDEEK